MYIISHLRGVQNLRFVRKTIFFLASFHHYCISPACSTGGNFVGLVVFSVFFFNAFIYSLPPGDLLFLFDNSWHRGVLLLGLRCVNVEGVPVAKTLLSI